MEFDIINQLERIECKDCGFKFYVFEKDRKQEELNCPRCKKDKLIYSYANIEMQIESKE